MLGLDCGAAMVQDRSNRGRAGVAAGVLYWCTVHRVGPGTGAAATLQPVQADILYNCRLRNTSKISAESWTVSAISRHPRPTPPRPVCQAVTPGRGGS